MSFLMQQLAHSLPYFSNEDLVTVMTKNMPTFVTKTINSKSLATILPDMFPVVQGTLEYHVLYTSRKSV